jgi:hypothetical protein
MSLRQLSIQWKITLLAGLCLAGIEILGGSLVVSHGQQFRTGEGLEHGDAQ